MLKVWPVEMVSMTLAGGNSRVVLITTHDQAATFTLQIAVTLEATAAVQTNIPTKLVQM